MLLEAAAAAWLYAQQASEDCFVFGEVSATEEEASGLQATGCPIKIERKGKLITLTSPKFIVEIAVPDMPGPQKFLYQWGQAEATIGNQVIHISYREVSGG
ncbi:MAG: hypothetical protein EPO02_09045 [Nitrospirae bacterium]|nr:MAG: hypothetical protein EPO02_09045 [Nitrospirota bacterium]